MYQEIEIGDDPKTYDDEVILRLKAEIAEIKDRYNKQIAMDTQLEAENANPHLHADECRELRAENARLKELSRIEFEKGVSVKLENVKLKEEHHLFFNEIDNLKDELKAGNHLFATVTDKQHDLEFENDKLKGYLTRSLIARCPDGECRRDCKKCPEVDGWLETILKDK